MSSSNLIRDYNVIYQSTPFMSMIAFDATISVWFTQSMLLFSDFLSFYFRGIREDNQVANIKRREHVCWRYFTHKSGMKTGLSRI